MKPVATASSKHEQSLARNADPREATLAPAERNICGLASAGSAGASQSAAGAGQPYHREVELKLQLPAGSRAILEACDCFKAVPAQQNHQVTTYFDTADGVLHAAGFVLRVRQIGGLHVQTVKSRADRRGLALSRREWAWPIGGAEPELCHLAHVEELETVGNAIAGKLVPLFVSDIERTTRIIDLDPDTIIEASFDEGHIAAGERSEAVSGLELELAQGGVGPLYKLAVRLQFLAPMWISTESKSARGAYLRTGQTEGGTEAKTPKLKRKMLAGNGLCLIIGGALGHLTSNIAPTLRGDPEGVHQMRGALRGCRAALELFAPLVEAASMRRFDAELQEFGRVFGTARDLDVFCRHTLPAAMMEMSGERFWDLQQAAEQRRRLAQGAVMDAVRGRNFTALILNLAAWTQEAAIQPCPIGDERMGKPLARVVPALLDRAAAKVAKRGRHVALLSPVARHSLRKSLDKLCDDVKFLARLFPRRDVARYRGRCEDVQAILGVANDGEVTRQLGLALVAQDRPDLAKPAAALTKWSDLKCRKILHGLQDAHDIFRATPAFWRGRG